MARKNSYMMSYSGVFIMTFVVFSGLLFYIFKDFLRSEPCANTLSCNETFEFQIDNGEKGIFNGETLIPPYVDRSDIYEDSGKYVLGAETEEGEKRIEVDLTNQTLKAFNGNDIFMDARISSGKWYPTPTGEFRIWTKIRASKMSGGEGASYYYLPNVPYIMFFSGSGIASTRGFALHGAYWHNNFGHPMSHGCVNMRTIDARKLYYWADPPTEEEKSGRAGKDSPGTKLIIYGKAP